MAQRNVLANINAYSTINQQSEVQNIPIFSSMPLTNHSNLRLGSPTGTTRHSKWACCPSHSSDGPVSSWVNTGFSNARSGSSGRVGARPSSSCFIFCMPSGCCVSSWILALATIYKQCCQSFMEPLFFCIITIMKIFLNNYSNTMQCVYQWSWSKEKQKWYKSFYKYK